MRTIYKYPVNRNPNFSIEMPAGSHILSVQMQIDQIQRGKDKAVMWVLVDTEKPLIERQFCLTTTGQEITHHPNGLIYIGTFQDGKFVGHLFEVKKIMDSKIDSQLDHDSLLYWYPKIVGMIPTPHTEWVDVADWRILCGVIDGDLEKKFEPYLPQVLATAKRVGYPLFMRTDLGSAKHEWDNTCFVPDEAGLLRNLGSLLDNTFACDMCSTALVFRQFIHMESRFTAFRGLPISKEFRFFIRDGEVLCKHFYWPEDAIDFWGDYKAPKKWRSMLRSTARLQGNDKTRLMDYAGRIAKEALTGFWSLDFCKAKNGVWYFIDAAQGDCSWHPRCKHNPRPQKRSI